MPRLDAHGEPLTMSARLARPRPPYVAWAAAITFLGALAFCCWREPLAVDAWGHYLHRQHAPATWLDLWTEARNSYFYSNPRLGQAITLLLYVDVVHLIVTPTLVGFVVLACFSLVTGRWPRLMSGVDWGLLSLITALLLLSVGNIGMMFFYRPYAGNYVYGFALYLAFLLPYRRALEARANRRRWWSAALAALGMCALGVAAGLTNEHTAPGVLVGLTGAGLWAIRHARATCRRVTVAPWMIAGMIGVAIGYAALMTAPGQLVRYDGVGREPFTRWVLERGWANFAWLAVGVAPLGPALIGWALGRRAPSPGRARQLVLFCVAVAMMICATLLFSPKIGLRLFWPASVLLVIATVAWHGPQLLAPRWMPWTTRLAALVIIGHAVVFTLAYAERIAEQTERLRRLRSAAPDTVVSLPCYRPRSMRYLVADDIDRPATRRLWQAELGVRVRAEGAYCAAEK